MNKIFRTLMIAMLIVGTACTTQAQDDDKKITIRITKQIDGETKTFEGEYASEEEMWADPAYREFAGDDKDISIWFGDDDMDNIFRFHHVPSANAFSFDFDDDEFFDKNFMKNFHFRSNGGALFFGDDDDNAIIDFRSWNSKEYEEELEKKMEELEDKLKDLDKDIRKEVMESMKEIQEMQSSMGFPKRIKRNAISISDVGDDFGKRGKVSKNEELELDDMNLMATRTRLNMRFRIKDQGELTIKISNEKGKDIYNRYYEQFGGTFSDGIDFSKYSEGKYLLEIQLDEKRLTKKIVID